MNPLNKKEILKQARAIRDEIDVLRQCADQAVSVDTLDVLQQSDCVDGITLMGCNSTEMYFAVYFIDQQVMEVILKVDDWRRSINES